MTRSPTLSRRARLEQLGLLSAAVAAMAAAPQSAAAATPNCQPWFAAAVYVAGNTATEGGKTYKANDDAVATGAGLRLARAGGRPAGQSFAQR